ncbi:toll-like receptor 4 [Mytilus edulis]|uniref:toll-like receptor 4 n=1 Tax=Mytilus edulis TaxID=6550 RepID=UPI0039F08F7A
MFLLMVYVLCHIHHVFMSTGENINNDHPSFTPCPFEPKCNCHYQTGSKPGVTADCSHKRLSDIPLVDSSVRNLDLSYNNIHDIPENIFQNSSSLIILDLSNNVIDILRNGSFNGLNSLRHLNLRSNLLVYKTTTFQDACFLQLKSLQELNIENNVGFYSAGQIFPKLSDLINLESLTMDGVDDKHLSVQLRNLTNLTSLKISNLSGICVIKSLETNAFINVPNLKRIEILKCQIKEIRNGTFRHLSKLQYVDFSYNTKLCFHGVLGLIYDLQFTSSKVLKLNKIHETFHMNTVVPVKFGEYLRNTSLVELHVDSNRIQEVDIGVLPNFPPSLDNISAADNDFSFGNYLYETLAMNISILNVSNLFSTHDISSGHINKRQVSPAFQRTSEFVQNYIDTVLNRGYGVNVHIPFPKNVKYFYIKRSLIRFTIPRCTLLSNSLVHFDGSENLVTAWIGPIYNIKTLKYLDLSSNFCSNISDFFFQDGIGIETLVVNDNLLGFIIPFDEKGYILSALTRLTKLNLAQNRIATIPRSFFRQQVALKTLDLSDNYLSDISFDIDHMNKLTKIDLSTNHISSLGMNAMKDLDDLNRKNNLTLDLSNNPLACNCKTIDFIKWISETDVHLFRRYQYKCLRDDNTKIVLHQPKLVYQHLKKECSSYGYVIAGVSVAIIFFIIILFFGVIYRYRWKLRYLYYMTKQKYRGYQLQQDRDETDYLYDAFISYADEDQMFVHDEMIKNLEDKYSMKLCLHKRDFTPGKDIAGNITNAIHNSRRTIVVMTENFLSSYWCMFEFNMARMETTYSRHGDKVLLMILYQPIAVKDLPLIMLELVQSESFIEYPRDHFGNDVFWIKIKEALE